MFWNYLVAMSPLDWRLPLGMISDKQAQTQTKLNNRIIELVVGILAACDVGPKNVTQTINVLVKHMTCSHLGAVAFKE